MAIWHRGKAKVNRLRGKAHKPTRPFPFPYEIVEMTIAYLSSNLDALRMCSLTCRSWCTVAVPILYRTLTLAGNGPEVDHSRLELLYGLGILPLVKQIQVVQSRGGVSPASLFRFHERSHPKSSRTGHLPLYTRH